MQLLSEPVHLVILAIELVNVAARGSAHLVRLVPIVTYLAVALVNTALEPWPGQIRYRAQVVVFLVVAIGLVTDLILEGGRAAVRRVYTEYYKTTLRDRGFSEPEIEARVAEEAERRRTGY